jgi:hypothetical protein
MKRQIQNILKTSEDVHWDIEKRFSDRKAIIVVKVGERPKPLTDIDWDIAMNVPSRLNIPSYKPKEYRLSITTDKIGDNIIKSRILKLKKVV